MASVIKSKTKTGIRYHIQLSPGERQSRPVISLGRANKAQATTAKMHVENLIKSSGPGSLPQSTLEWLSNVSDGLRKRLEVLKIIEPRENSKTYTVEQWTEKYITSRPDVKQRTRDRLQNAANKLTAFFRGQYLGDITVKQAKDFRAYLKTTCLLGENTLRRIIGMSRQFFNAAIDAELISKNPFRGQSVAVRANSARFFFITPEMAVRVLAACPNSQWRLIFGLCRYGGLRCPSEVLAMKWEDVDFEHGQFTVHSTKTEHHAGGGIRTVPMFLELRPLFQDAFDHAKEGDVYCITRYRSTSVNLRTHMHRVIKKAGLEPWPKTFQNLRSTRETELFKMTGGNVKAVCSWIGNSPAVAMQHYAQVTEADVQEAAKMTLIKDAEKIVHNTVHNTVQTPIVSNSETLPAPEKQSDINPYNDSTKHELATVVNCGQKDTQHARQESNMRKASDTQTPASKEVSNSRPNKSGIRGMQNHVHNSRKSEIQQILESLTDEQVKALHQQLKIATQEGI